MGSDSCHERRLASAIVELRSALHELEQFGTEAHEAGRDHRWRALEVACHEQAAVLEELDGLGNGCPSFVAVRMSLTVQSS
jgi:hypothetical protein